MFTGDSSDNETDFGAFMKTMRDAFFDEVFKLDAMVVTADMGAPALDKFRGTDKYLNVGIAEQNMITVASGLALSGKKVFVYAIMPFATLRCFEIIKSTICAMNLPVTIVGVGAGFSYEDSGPTHHSTEDISVMRSLPNMTILSPSSSGMASLMASIPDTPTYVRLDRETLPEIQRGSSWDVRCPGEGLDYIIPAKTVIITTGNMVHTALKTGFGVMDIYKLKPLNERLLLKHFEGIERVVTLEEHILDGGLGSIIAEFMADNGILKPLKRIGVDKYYYDYGREHLQKLCRLDVESVTKTIQDWVQPPNM